MHSETTALPENQPPLRPWGEEQEIERVHEFCIIVDRPATRLVGIEIPVNFESQAYPGGQQMNDYALAQKYITDGTIALLAEALGICLKDTVIVSARRRIYLDGNYRVIVGIPVDQEMKLPMFLPEHTAELLLPGCRYAKIDMNGQKKPGRRGFGERMAADDYFIGSFRRDTAYLYEPGGYPMNTWDGTGDMLAKYEPVRKKAAEEDRFATMEFTPVLLPPMKIACCMRPHGEEEGNCISDFFQVQDKVFAAAASIYYQNSDYYGFPIDAGDSYKSCFGSRVATFGGLPDCVEQVTLPGGKYVHITQKEFNGDNPSLLYEVAFEHMEQLYFRQHPEYEFDPSRKVIARFRQSNCASVFVPVRQRCCP